MVSTDDLLSAESRDFLHSYVCNNKNKSAKQEAANGRGDASRMEGAKKEKAGSKLSVEQVYQKKMQLEHILLQPDTYIGTVEPITQVSPEQTAFPCWLRG